MILVKFSRNGCYIPAFGRMGMGDNSGRIYQLPDVFKEEGMLPKSAKILDHLSDDELEEELEEAGQTKPDKPRADKEELEKATALAKSNSEKAAKARKAKAAAKKAAEPVVELEPEPEPEPEPPAVAKRSRRRVS